MHEAVLTTRIGTGFPIIPVYAVPELIPGFEILLPNQIARTFPTERCAGDIAPRSAGILTFSGGELQKQRRRAESVALREFQYAFELLVNLLSKEKMIILKGFVVVTRRDQHVVDTELREEGKHLLNLLHLGFPIDSRICTDRISKLLAHLEHVNRFVEHTFTRTHKVMCLAHTIQM